MTLRNIHNKLDRAGNISGNTQDYKTVNWDDVPEITMREIHNKPDRAGNVSGNTQNYKAVNWNDVPEITMREIHSGGRGGNVSGNTQNYKAVNWNDVPEITMREIHSGGRTANVTGNSLGHKTIDWDDIPDVTMREIHSGGREAGAGGGNYTNGRQTSRHQFMAMKTNAGKEDLEKGRMPTKVGMNKGWTIDHTVFQFKEMIDPKWRPGPGSDIMYNNDTLSTTNTKVPTNRYWINDRILANTEKNLEGNPFINNLLHQSI